MTAVVVPLQGFFAIIWKFDESHLCWKCLTSRFRLEGCTPLCPSWCAALPDALSKGRRTCLLIFRCWSLIQRFGKQNEFIHLRKIKREQSKPLYSSKFILLFTMLFHALQTRPHPVPVTVVFVFLHIAARQHIFYGMTSHGKLLPVTLTAACSRACAGRGRVGEEEWQRKKTGARERGRRGRRQGE